MLKIGEILFPFFSTLQTEDDERRVDLLLRSSWILNVLAASALGGLIPVAGALLYRWTSAEVAAEAQLVLVVLAISGILGIERQRVCVLSAVAGALQLQRADLAASRASSRWRPAPSRCRFSAGRPPAGAPVSGWSPRW